MIKAKKLLALISFILAFISVFVSPIETKAGFGITPPYVRNDTLTRNSHYEQKILLVRSDPNEDLQAKITVNIPKAEEWISIDKGTEFILPKGQAMVPMIVAVTVPDEAEFGNYKGNIKVVITPAQGPAAGTVGIALGAQIDVDLNVIDKKILDFKVKRIGISDLEEGHKFWWFFFPGKIVFTMQIENIGNIAYGPTKVVFDIYDIKGQTLLESTKNTNKIEKVKPFEIKEVFAELPTRLLAGAYKAQYKIYKGEEVSQAGELNLSILPYGILPVRNGYGFIGLSLKDKSIIILFGVLVLVGLGYGGIKIIRKKSKIKYQKSK